VKGIGRDQQKLNEFQTYVTAYMFASILWRSSNEFRNTWWFL